MAEVVVAQRMWQRRDTAANWTSKNPILNAGEIGVELGATPADTKFKIGDGTTPWTTLPYFSGGGGGGGDFDLLQAYLDAEATGTLDGTEPVMVVQGGELRTTSVAAVASFATGAATASAYLTAIFLGNGTFRVPADVTSVDVLVVGGGGGGGGRQSGGGGGAGGVNFQQGVAVTPGSDVTVTVGAGGLGRDASALGQGLDGAGSAFGAVTAAGGGGGGQASTTAGPLSAGRPGGSGGGAGRASTVAPGGAGTSGQGFAGGSNAATATTSTDSFGGGGGGASGPGKNRIGGSNNGGGPGRYVEAFSNYPISGGWFGGGGGGGDGGLGGVGGGGTGGTGTGTAVNGTSGVNGTGGGGGGGGSGSSNTGAAGNGGSGVVLIRYAQQLPASQVRISPIAGMAATNVQQAIQELKNMIDAI